MLKQGPLANKFGELFLNLKNPPTTIKICRTPGQADRLGFIRSNMKDEKNK